MKSLRALIVEDSEQDAMLLVRQLQKAGYPLAHRRVETKREMSDALRGESWDIVLCDYVLPEFSGLEAIELVRQHDPDLPLIVISGQIGEDTAVSAMKAGAQDYIIKGNLKRLVPAIERELAEAENRKQRRKVENELRQYHENLEQVVEQRTRALMDSEAKASALIKYAPTGIYEIDFRTGQFINLNDAVCNLTGYSREELMNMDLSTLLEEESKSIFAERIRRYKSGEEIGEAVEYKMRKKDGSFIFIMLNVSFPKQKPNTAFVIGHDVTGQKKAEAEIAYRATFPELSPNPVIEIDSGGNIVYANPAIRALFQDLKTRGKNHPYLADWGNWDLKVDEEIKTSVYTRNVQIGDCWYEQAISRVPSSQNLRIYGRDITKGKKAEAELRESEERYKNLVESSNSIIMRADKDLNITYMNNFGLRFFGYTADELIGQNVVGKTIPQKDSSGKDLAAMANDMARQPEKYITNVHQNMRKNGELVWVSWTNKTKYDRDGNVTEILAIGNDLTELKKAENIKDEFIGMVSHEIKTPLTVIIGALAVAMSEGVSEEDAKDLVRDAYKYSENLASIVENLLELSRYQSNRLIITPEATYLERECQSIARKLGARSNIHHISVNIPQDMPIVRVDPLRLERVLYNLVENAIKYSPNGGEINISAMQKNSRMIVSISDQGIGIKAENMAKLFNSFERLEAYETYSIPGLGLGLRVCDILVTAHGGKIWVESEEGKGSTFYFTIPLK